MKQSMNSKEVGRRPVSMPDTCSLLLVEDDFELREILGAALQLGGCRVTAVGSPDDALRAARAADFHVALIDRGLNGKDGLALIAALRECNADLQPIMLSGWSNEEAVAAAAAAGAFECLAKPCRLAHLREVVQRAYRASVAREVSNAL
jgi:DNA-binding NtrC family response regulator